MTTEEQLKIFGYTKEWLEYGIISEVFLKKQIEEYNHSDDKNTEHYRWSGFLNFIKNKSDLKDDEIEKILKLRDEGNAGENLRSNRIYVLITSGILNDNQFKGLNNPSILFSDSLKKNYKRHQLLREIKTTRLTLEIIEKIKTCGDSWIQEIVLEHKQLEYELLNWLIANGKNKKVRNMANALKRFKTDTSR